MNKQSFIQNYFFNKNRIYLDNKHNCLLNKNLFLLMVQILIFIPMICTLIFGYDNQYIKLPLQEVPENIATYRSISIFLMLWYLVIYLFLIRFQINDKYVKLFNWLSFVPIFNILNIIIISFKNNWIYFLYWFKQNFAPDFHLTLIYTRRSWKYKMMVGLLIIMTPIVVLVFYQQTDFLNTYPMNGNGDLIVFKNLWFCSIQYFTIQTNLLCYLFVLLFVINPNLKIFKYHSFLIACIVYIFVVGVTYDFALFPIKIVNGDIKQWDWYKYLTNIYEHLIDPVAFITCGLIIICKDNPQILRLRYKKYIVYTMIIPSIYLIYATILPFITNVSVYGFVTNCNPNVYNEVIVDKPSFMAHGDWYNIFFIIGYWFLFICLLSGIYYLDLKKANKWKGFKYENLQGYY